MVSMGITMTELATLRLWQLISPALPVGVQFVARNGDEATLLQLAAHLEAAHPWPKTAPLAATS